MLTIQQRVENGVKFLDERLPDWKTKINIEEINIATFDKCILGQIFGNFCLSFEKLNHEFSSLEELGFIVSCSNFEQLPQNTLELNKAWKEYLTNANNSTEN